MIRFFFLILISIFLISGTNAQVNDECSGAVILTVSSGPTCQSFVTGDVKNATSSLNAIECNGYTAGTPKDLWYAFTATGPVHAITVKSSGDFDAVIDLRSVSCSGTTIGCADKTGNGEDEVVVAKNLKAGVKYYVRVYGWNANTSSTFSICVSVPVTQINDECSSAISLPISANLNCSSFVSGSFEGATPSLEQFLSCSQSGGFKNDVWYSFTATKISHIITINASSGFDPVMEFRSGTCPGTVVQCVNNTQNGGTETIKASSLIPGTKYFIRLFHYDSTPLSFTFNICISTPVLQVNDECLQAVPLTVSNTLSDDFPVDGSVEGATQSLPPVTCQEKTGADVRDVWYSFIAKGTSQIISVKAPEKFNTVIDLRASCTDTSKDCADDKYTGKEMITANNLVSGKKYYVRIYHYFSDPEEKTFSVSVTSPVAITSNCDRVKMVNNYLLNYISSNLKTADYKWSGDTATCKAGTISATAQNKTLSRINYYRGLNKLSPVTFDPALAPQCQEAALIMHANTQLNHYPPVTWKCYSEVGAQAASKSNLAYGPPGMAIDNYMDDFGANNVQVGHRNWILYPIASVFGHGATIVTDALWVINTTVPAPSVIYISYPAEGYFPATLLPSSNRWSLYKTGASFTNATVTMTDPAGNSIVAIPETYSGGYAFVWKPTGIINNSPVDIPYTVKVKNIMVDGIMENYTYVVNISQPEFPVRCPENKKWSETECSCKTIPTGLTHETETNLISIFPNPTSQIATISITKESFKNAFVEISDMNGIVVKTIIMNSQAETTDLSALHNGVYTIVARENNGTSFRIKLVVSK